MGRAAQCDGVVTTTARSGRCRTPAPGDEEEAHAGQGHGQADDPGGVEQGAAAGGRQEQRRRRGGPSRGRRRGGGRSGGGRRRRGGRRAPLDRCRRPLLGVGREGDEVGPRPVAEAGGGDRGVGRRVGAHHPGPVLPDVERLVAVRVTAEAGRGDVHRHERGGATVGRQVDVHRRQRGGEELGGRVVGLDDRPRHGLTGLDGGRVGRDGDGRRGRQGGRGRVGGGAHRAVVVLRRRPVGHAFEAGAEGGDVGRGLHPFGDG